MEVIETVLDVLVSLGHFLVGLELQDGSQTEHLTAFMFRLRSKSLDKGVLLYCLQLDVIVVLKQA